MRMKKKKTTALLEPNCVCLRPLCHNGQQIAIQTITPQKRLDKVEIVPAKRLEKGKETKLKLVYTGNISETLGGLYQTTYFENGIKKEKSGDWVTTTFYKTPKMSSYLLALMVSEFTHVEKYTESGVRYRIYARKEATAANMTLYALNAGVKCLEYYNKLFDYKFPLDKQG
ncbi:unnamed protein product [Strongylus vulgaris]|uniref:Uncharacterized protein n=1 Tax=Strongylus vulgaris TaxID=40348 RepID=A0A3P7IYN8_STRVU|nr:unnamed protein product [Strongylus vulgaris]